MAKPIRRIHDQCEKIGGTLEISQVNAKLSPILSKFSNSSERACGTLEYHRFMEKSGIAMGGQALMQHMPDLGYFAKDREGRFIAANSAFAEIAGTEKPEGLLGKTDHDIWPRFLADHYLKDDDRVMKTGAPMVNKIELVIRQDRSTEWFATTKVPLADPAGEVTGVEGVCRYLKKAKTPDEKALRMPAVMAHIMEHYAERIEIPALAAMVSLSVKQFERRFKQEFSEVPVKYIQRIRLDAACQLLAMTRLTIAQVGRETGFYDSSHFSNQFSKYTGDTPKAFRQKHFKNS